MVALLRALVFSFVVLSVIYVSLWFFLRTRRREMLELDWQTDIRDGDQDAWVKAQLESYDQRRKRTLFWIVYVAPLSIVAAIVYATN